MTISQQNEKHVEEIDVYRLIVAEQKIHELEVVGRIDQRRQSRRPQHRRKRPNWMRTCL
jgi:hypothetical protein